MLNISWFRFLQAFWCVPSMGLKETKKEPTHFYLPIQHRNEKKCLNKNK